MRNTVLILLLSTFQVFAVGTYAQTKTISLAMHDATIRDVLFAIQNQSEFYFLYNSELVDVTKKVDISIKGEKVDEILTRLFDKSKVDFLIKDRYIVLTPVGGNVELFDQPSRITGKVTDSFGQPLPSVTVVIKGTTQGTVTTSDGEYILTNIPEDATLVFSFVGMKTQEIPVGGQTSIDVVMQEEAIGLEEVVAIGYGTVKKSDLTGSVTKVSGEEFSMQPLTQITEMLAGTVAGFNSSQGTSASGGGSLEIRGPTSLSAGTDPLIVLDGVIYNGSIRDINPMDIESLDILKDASSSAIFGAKAASGVVIITTTKGKTGKPTINFSTKMGLAEVTNKDMRPFSPKGFTDFRRDFLGRLYPDLPQYYFYSPDELPGNISVSDWSNYSDNPNSNNYVEWLSRLQLTNPEIENYLNGRTVDWYDQVMQKGFRQSYDVSINGGGESLSYYWSLGYTDNEGIIVGDKYSALRSRLNVSAKISDFLSVGTNTQFAFRDESDIQAQLRNMFNNTPYATMYNEDGTLKWFPNDQQQNAQNPLLNTYYQDKQKNIYSLVSSLYADIILPLGFSYRIVYQPRMGFTKNYNFWSTSTIVGAIDHSGGYGTREDSQFYEWQVDNILKWNKDVGIHSFDFTFLYNAEKYQSWYSFQSAEEFSPNEKLSFHSLQSGAKLTIDNNDTYSTGDAVMGRLNYTLMDKYLLTASVRQDGYSAFGLENKRAIFPALALAWQASRENFWNNDWLVNRLKMRLSWGVNGNRDIGVYSALAKLSQNFYYNGSQVQIGVYNSSLANAQLSWEKTEAYNLGVDVGLFDNRIDITADAYVSTTKDLLMLRNLPKITGFSDIYSNLGELKNKGLEFSVNSVNITNSRIKWNSSLVFSLNRNEIVELFGDVGEYTLENEVRYGELPDFTNRWFPGQAIDRIWDYDITGVWQLDQADEAAKYNQSPGDYIAVDVNEDGIYTESNDKRFVGWKQPRYRIGLRNEVSFLKHFTASAFLRAELGHIGSIAIFKGTSSSYERTSTREFPYWTPDNPSNKYGAVVSYSGLYSGGFNTYFPRSYLRVQDLSISYNVPKKVIEHLNFERVRVYGNVRNLLTFDGWMDWDPESGSSPMPRVFTLGFDLSF
ncbi:SusC/RagA family TonB-linked outer membrane protein [Mariniphaga anaerophila]|nr:SusC/RagA family TonB-linked outer membrane protein [Mariniphaga anaerophila]